MSFKEFVKEFGLDDKEKLERMASVKPSTGGRLEMPAVGQAVTVLITGEPRKVEPEKLKEMGIKESWVCRVRKVDAKGNVSDVEYDLFISKTIAMGLTVALKRDYGIEPKDFSDYVGKVFTIAGTEWKDAPADYRENGKVVKTYRVTGRPELVSTAGVVVDENEIEL